MFFVAFALLGFKVVMEDLMEFGDDPPVSQDLLECQTAPERNGFVGPHMSGIFTIEPKQIYLSGCSGFSVDSGTPNWGRIVYTYFDEVA